MASSNFISKQPHSLTPHPTAHPRLQIRSSPTDPSSSSSHLKSRAKRRDNVRRDGGDRRRSEGAGGVAEPVRGAAEDRAEPEGRGVRVPRGNVRQQERASPKVQPGLQEDPRPHPRRKARLRVHDHRPVHRRGLGPLRPRHPPLRPLRPRRRPLLGRLHRRQVFPGNQGNRNGTDGGGEGGVRGAAARRAAAAGGGLREMQQGEALLRRGQHRVPRHRPRQQPGVAQGGGEDIRQEAPRRGEDASAGGVGRAVLRRCRGEGGDTGDRQAGGVRQGASGQAQGRASCQMTSFCCCS